jgi:hypothetical protein
LDHSIAIVEVEEAEVEVGVDSQVAVMEIEDLVTVAASEDEAIHSVVVEEEVVTGVIQEVIMMFDREEIVSGGEMLEIQAV